MKETVVNALKGEGLEDDEAGVLAGILEAYVDAVAVDFNKVSYREALRLMSGVLYTIEEYGQAGAMSRHLRACIIEMSTWLKSSLAQDRRREEAMRRHDCRCCNHCATRDKEGSTLHTRVVCACTQQLRHVWASAAGDCGDWEAVEDDGGE